MSNKPNRFSNLALFAHIGTFPTRNLNKDLFRTYDVSMHSRYIPDTYPTHTRYICIPHEYPTNTPRMPHEYPTQRISMREVVTKPEKGWLPTYFLLPLPVQFSATSRRVSLVSLLAVLCTAVVRRVSVACSVLSDFSPSIPCVPIGCSVHGGGPPCFRCLFSSQRFPAEPVPIVGSILGVLVNSYFFPTKINLIFVFFNIFLHICKKMCTFARWKGGGYASSAASVQQNPLKT